MVFDDQAKRSCIIPPVSAHAPSAHALRRGTLLPAPDIRANNSIALQGRCWIEGDNAAKSGDSRTMYGPVHVGLLEGRATHVVWPPWRFSRVPEYVPEGRLLVQRATPAGAAADAAADTSLS